MKKVLFATSECRPFIASGGLADVVGSLPYAFSSSDVKASVVLPYYSEVAQKYGSKVKMIDTRVISLDWRRQQAYLHKMTLKKINFYFIDCTYYFGRPNLYGYTDDIERFCFFSTAVVEFLGSKFDIIHCNDWQTALIPALVLDRRLPAKTVLTIHNIAYQGNFAVEHLQDLTGFSAYNYGGVFEWKGQNNLLKGGIVMCNALTTVSPSYANEISWQEFGCGLHEIINDNKGKLVGILNGIDYKLYDPAKDKTIARKFTADTLADKEINKKALQREMLLPETDQPLFAMVTRFAYHKGVSLVCEIIEKLLSQNLQFVVLGDGDPQIADYFDTLCKTKPNFRVYLGFNNELAKKIYAGADFFVMPSKSEPCGLAQMIACRYATIPIVRSVGGLHDSIRNLNNGLSFGPYNSWELENATSKAQTLYWNKAGLEKIRINCMNSDFSWAKSAQEYAKLYERL